MARHGFLIAAATMALLSPTTRAQTAAEVHPLDLDARGLIDNPICPPAESPPPRWWARGEYVFWAIGTGKLTEIFKEAINSDLFNALLDAAGKDYGDVAHTLLGSDRNGFRVNVGAWLDDSTTV